MSYYQSPPYQAGVAQNYAGYNQAYTNTDSQYNEYGYSDNPNLPAAAQPTGVSAWVNFSNDVYLKGFLVGAAITLVAANPKVQKAIVKGAVKVWSSFQGGVEEVKEQFQDAKAEMSQQ